MVFLVIYHLKFNELHIYLQFCKCIFLWKEYRILQLLCVWIRAPYNELIESYIYFYRGKNC